MRAAPALWLLAAPAMLALTGCGHRTVLAAAPPPPPPPVMVSVPPPSHPTEPEPEIPLASVPPLTLLIPQQTRTRLRFGSLRPLLPPLEEATAAAPPMELGNLTTGDESGNNDLRQQTGDLLRTQHRRLAGIGRGVAALHTSQMEHAKLFLRQADDAWRKQDIEGARTLATKAKLILDEVLG